MPIQLTRIGSFGGYPPSPIKVKVTGIFNRFAKRCNTLVAPDIMIHPPPKIIGRLDCIIHFAAFLTSGNGASLGILYPLTFFISGYENLASEVKTFFEISTSTVPGLPVLAKCYASLGTLERSFISSTKKLCLVQGRESPT